MEKGYWEKIAPNYETEIFDVLHHDKSGKIVKAIKEFAGKKNSVIDIGCGIGKWVPILSPLFKDVMAIDISTKNLAIAEKKYVQYKNVKFDRIDMSTSTIKTKKYAAAICINAILSESLKKRDIFIRQLSSFIKKGGDLVLVVPSLESKLFSHIIANKWNIDQVRNIKPPTGKKAINQIKYIKEGVTDIDDVPTKHFLKEEIELLLSIAGFKVIKIEKIKYKWTTEFHKPPSWLKKPLPWDWMVKAKKQ